MVRDGDSSAQLDWDDQHRGRREGSGDTPTGHSPGSQAFAEASRAFEYELIITDKRSRRRTIIHGSAFDYDLDSMRQMHTTQTAFGPVVRESTTIGITLRDTIGEIKIEEGSQHAAPGSTARP